MEVSNWNERANNGGNFMGGNNNPNPSGYATAQPDPNGFDIGKFLQTVLNNNGIDPNKIPGNTITNVPAVNPATNLHDDQAAALQSVLNKYDKQQAEEAFNSKGPEAMRQLLDYHYNTAPSEQDNSTSEQKSPTQPVQQQTQNVNIPKQGFFEHPDNYGQRLTNAGVIQKLIAGQPAEIAVPQAQAAEIQQKIAGAVPLQPADIVKLNVDTYSAALKANQDAYANSNTEVANLTKTLDILQQGRSTWGKAFGGNTDIMNSLKQVIAAKTAQNATISKNQKRLMDNAPVVAGQDKNQSSGFKVIGVR